MIRLATCPQCHRACAQIPSGLAIVLVCVDCKATWFSAPEPERRANDPEPETSTRVAHSITLPVQTIPGCWSNRTVRG